MPGGQSSAAGCWGWAGELHGGRGAGPLLAWQGPVAAAPLSPAVPACRSFNHCPAFEGT